MSAKGLPFLTRDLSGIGGLALKKIGIFFLPLSVTLLFSFLNPTSTVSQDSFHKKIILRGSDGNPLTSESKAPYSPRKTCGGCHDYDQITNGYHFQQGRTDGTGKIVISDTFDSQHPWTLSSGA